MTNGSAWILLIASGIVDVAWAYSVKKTDGFSNWPWFIASLFLLALFIVLLTKALQVLPLGPAYAIWTGIGAAGSFIVGAVWLGEPVSALRIALILMIIAGVIGLKMTTQ